MKYTRHIVSLLFFSSQLYKIIGRLSKWAELKMDWTKKAQFLLGSKSEAHGSGYNGGGLGQAMSFYIFKNDVEENKQAISISSI